MPGTNDQKKRERAAKKRGLFYAKAWLKEADREEFEALTRRAQPELDKVEKESE